MHTKKAIKVTLTSLLILLIFSPILFFLIYPLYNSLTLSIKALNPYNIAKDNAVLLFTKISPTKDSFGEKVLGITTIEESIDLSEVILDEKILENLNTSLEIQETNIAGQIFQGISSETMNKGFWHFPTSQYPGQKGNVVIIGHRYMNIPPALDTFYNLDRVNIGQKIVIKHKEGEYTYIVVESKIVDANDITIVQETQDYRLTLITCTPLWTSEKRLVVIAKLDKLYKKV